MAKVTLAALARSSSLAGISSLWLILSRIFLTPIILASLGLEGYGVWVLLFSLGGSVNFMGVSFGQAYEKLTAEHDSRADYATLSMLVGSGIALVGGLGAIGLGALALLRTPVLSAVGVPPEMVADAGTALLLVTCSMLLTMSFGSVYHVLAGLQRTDLRFTSIIVSSFVYFVLAIVLVSRGWGLVGLGTSFLVGEVIAIGLAYFWARRLCPELRVRPTMATWAGIRKIASLGGRFQVLYFLGYLTVQGPKVLLSVLMGPAMVGVFEIANKLIRLSASGSAAVHAPMMPAFANLYSTGDQVRAQRMLRQGARALMVVSIVCFGFVAIFADRAILLWTGAGYEGAAMTNDLAAWTIRAVAAAWVFRQISGSLSASLRAREMFRLEIVTGLLAIALHLIGIAVLYPSFGYQGFVVAWAVSMVVSTLYFLIVFARVEGFPLWRFLNEVAISPSAVLVGVVLATTALVAATGFTPSLAADRWTLVRDLALCGVAYSAVCAAAVWFLVLDAQEKSVVAGLVARLGGAGRQAQSEG